MTHRPDVITYSSVVTRENLHIALNIAALHDLEIKAAGAINAYVTASNRESIQTALDPEFGDNTGKSTITVQALCGLKCAGALFRACLA